MFKSARIKLTLWYLLIISTITIGFSIILYNGVINTTRRALINHQLHMELMYNGEKDQAREINRLRRYQTPVTEETIGSIKHGVFVIFSILDVIIIVISSILGYLLAGLTLKPIEIMLNNQRRFIADAAHELKTPISAIKLMFEVALKDKSLTLKDSKILIQKSINEIDYIDSLIQTLLKESKYQLNSKKSDITSSLLVSEAIRESVKHVKIMAQKKKVRIKLHLDGLNDQTVRFDKDSFLELMIILLDNAIKYNRKNGKVDVYGNVKHRYLYIKIKDTGIGIKDADLPFIFDRFYKVDKSRSKDGFGLGLSIVKDILSQNNGEIKVNSTVNKGSTFTLKLPL